MSATFTPYCEAQAHRDPIGSDAYIRVRVPDGPCPDGSILVYLPNGTGLVVNSNQLLHLDAGRNCRGDRGDPTSISTVVGKGATPDCSADQARADVQLVCTQKEHCPEGRVEEHCRQVHDLTGRYGTERSVRAGGKPGPCCEGYR
jgi:hypothetical protein